MVDTDPEPEPDPTDDVTEAEVDAALPGDREPGDGSVEPPSATGDVDALRSTEPDEGPVEGAPTPLETPLE